MEENVGESVVKRILMGDGSYVIVLHSNRMIDNIANFCCCDNPDFRSQTVLYFGSPKFPLPVKVRSEGIDALICKQLDNAFPLFFYQI